MAHIDDFDAIFEINARHSIQNDLFKICDDPRLLGTSKFNSNVRAHDPTIRFATFHPNPHKFIEASESEKKGISKDKIEPKLVKRRLRCLLIFVEPPSPKSLEQYWLKKAKCAIIIISNNPTFKKAPWSTSSSIDMVPMSDCVGAKFLKVLIRRQSIIGPDGKNISDVLDDFDGDQFLKKLVVNLGVCTRQLNSWRSAIIQSGSLLENCSWRVRRLGRMIRLGGQEES